MPLQMRSLRPVYSETMYNEFQPITTLAGIKAFASYLYFDLSTNFHPEDDFNDYTRSSSEEKAFTPIRAERLNMRMSECRDVCEENGVDICDVMNVATPYINLLLSGHTQEQAKKAVHFASDGFCGEKR